MAVEFRHDSLHVVIDGSCGFAMLPVVITNMPTVVKKQSPIVVPDWLRRRAGISPGDRLEMKALRGVITIIARRPPAADEYTPAQRRIIDAEIAQAQKGPYYGPFDTAEQMIASMQAELKKRAGKKKLSKRSG